MLDQGPKEYKENNLKRCGSHCWILDIVCSHMEVSHCLSKESMISSNGTHEFEPNQDFCHHLPHVLYVSNNDLPVCQYQHQLSHGASSSTRTSSIS